jgi:DNA replication and repair protein RecF
MALTSLYVKHFRVIDEATLLLSPHLNVVVGANGAGKTSLLEAVHMLARARSFRSGPIHAVVQREREQLGVYGRIQVMDASSDIPVGIEKSQDETRIKMAGRSIHTASELASWFPLQVMGADSLKLITEGARERRAFLDWGIFQLTPESVVCWQRFNNALKQRNAALKQKMEIAVCAAWDDELAQNGERIHTLRLAYIEQLQPIFMRVWDAYGLELMRPQFRYVRGWSQEASFREALAQGMMRDREYGYTRIGPQRAELFLESSGVSVDEVFSRGQIKLLAVTLLVAQVQLMMQAEIKTRPMVLVDDLTAELDARNSARTMELLLNPGLQLFVTTLDPRAAFLPTHAQELMSVFHVEQGRFSAYACA